VFGEMDFDRRIWERLAADGPEALPAAGRLDEMMPELQEALGATPYEIHAAIARLRRRMMPRKRE